MKIRRIGNYLMLLVAWFIMGTSCTGFFDNNTEPVAYGDAMIRVYKQGDSLMFNRLFYTYSSTAMDAVKVRAKSNDETIDLDTIRGKYTFAHLPELSSYSSTPPDDDTYYFDITFSDKKTAMASDYLYNDYIEPAEFTTLEWDTISNKVNLKWEHDESTDYNKIMLLDSVNKIVFETDFIEYYYTEMSLYEYSLGWIDSYEPENGSVFKVMIISYLYEYDVSAFDIQCLAVNDLNSFTWGVNDEELE